MLDVKDLHVALSRGQLSTEIVRGVELTLRPGETYALVGESGCGKSMTALALMGLLPESLHVTQGSIRLDGDELTSMTDDELCACRGGRIGMVFQEPSTSLNPVMTVGEQLTEVMRLHGSLDRQTNRRKAVEWLDRVGIDRSGERIDAYPFELSGGQKQRVMIAMALAAEPSVVLADEPTTALDVTLQAQILDLLKNLQRERGIALLLITHDLALVRRYADWVGLMYAGEIVEEAPVSSFFRTPTHPYAKGLLRSIPSSGTSREVIPITGVVPPMDSLGSGCAFADRCPNEAPACRENRIAMREIGTEGHMVRCLRFENQEVVASGINPLKSTMGASVLEAKNLCVGYRERGNSWRQSTRPALCDVSLGLRRGETLALVGESGSGKTTFAKAVLRLLDENAVVTGHVSVDGIDALRAKGGALRRLHAKAQIVFQDPFASLNPRMRIGECLEEGMKSLLSTLEGAERAKRVSELLKTVGLPESSADRYPHEFSGGQRQRIAIARALAVEPEIIICDEPTSALDVSVQAQILNLLRKIQRERGIAYLLITHNFAVVEYLADTVAVMRAGRIVEYGATKEVLHKPQNPYTRELIAAVPRL